MIQLSIIKTQSQTVNDYRTLCPGNWKKIVPALTSISELFINLQLSIKQETQLSQRVRASAQR